jgi:hypothetical protein
MEILTGRTFTQNKKVRKLSVFSSLMSNYSFNDNFCQKMVIYLESLSSKLYIDIYVYYFCVHISMNILSGRTFTQNKIARKLSVFLCLISNHSFNINFCQKMIIYLESV